MTNRLIALLADYLIIPIILVPLFLWFKGFKPPAVRAVYSGVLAWAISWVFKNFYYLPRPFMLTGESPIIDFLFDGSFPSGHTALSLGISFALFAYFPKVSLLLIVASLLIGSGRVLAGVHSPADILGGTLIALFASFLTKKRH